MQAYAPATRLQVLGSAILCVRERSCPPPTAEPANSYAATRILRYATASVYSGEGTWPGMGR